MEDWPLLPQYQDLITQLRNQHLGRGQSLIRENAENERIIGLTTELITSISPGTPVAVARALNNLTRLLLQRRAQIAREIRRLDQIRSLFFPSTDVLTAPSYTHFTVLNHRADFIQTIEPLQQRVDDYEIAVDSALLALVETLPPSSPTHFQRTIIESVPDGSSIADGSHSLDSSQEAHLREN
jgi:hypothetical protein